jgi:hypothetical protein
MQFKKRRVVVFSLFLLITSICCYSISCNNDHGSEVVKTDGKSLSEKYCKSCHQYPGAEMLDQETWIKHVLPAMAPRLGIRVYADDQYVYDPAAKSVVAYEDWLKIVNYYKSASPKALTPAKVPVVAVKDWGVFKMIKPVSNKTTIATTTMVAFDTIGRRIFTSDGMRSSVDQWSDKLKLQSSNKYNSPAVNVQFNKGDKGNELGVFTFIGSMDAVDILNGKVIEIDLNATADKKETLIADKLPRPIQSLQADFNKDGLTDWVVCGFGHNLGGLYWYKQLPGKQFEKKTIREIPGAEQAVIGDFNHDGWPDIACLFAHADEGIWMFLNDHKGGFTTTNLLRFSPVFGSSSFQLVDFNHDGKLDILYTSGDNSDYSKILKPFHGVYIYLNQGNFKYKQAYFYPVNGATKAVATDFNGDGELDIAVIAFFSDLKNDPSEGFTYFEQDKPMHFIPHRLPLGGEGRWICMDVADYNADGKPDILLGNFSLGFINEDGLKPNWNTHVPFVLLENIDGLHK